MLLLLWFIWPYRRPWFPVSPAIQLSPQPALMKIQLGRRGERHYLRRMGGSHLLEGSGRCWMAREKSLQCLYSTAATTTNFVFSRSQFRRVSRPLGPGSGPQKTSLPFTGATVVVATRVLVSKSSFHRESLLSATGGDTFGAANGGMESPVFFQDTDWAGYGILPSRSGAHF